jgi:hypothetical protein
VSRGPGRLQKAIIDELRKAPGTELLWAKLKNRFPKESAQHSLHRAVQSLRERGLVFDHYVFGRRYVALTVLGDTDLRALCDAAHRQLALLAKARKVPVPPLAGPGVSSTPASPLPIERRPGRSRESGDT